MVSLVSVPLRFLRISSVWSSRLIRPGSRRLPFSCCVSFKLNSKGFDAISTLWSPLCPTPLLLDRRRDGSLFSSSSYVFPLYWFSGVSVFLQSFRLGRRLLLLHLVNLVSSGATCSPATRRGAVRYGGRCRRLWGHCRSGVFRCHVFSSNSPWSRDTRRAV